MIWAKSGSLYFEVQKCLHVVMYRSICTCNHIHAYAACALFLISANVCGMFGCGMYGYLLSGKGMRSKKRSNKATSTAKGWSKP